MFHLLTSEFRTFMEPYFICCLVLLISFVEVVSSEQKVVHRGESVLLFANVAADSPDNQIHLYINGEKNYTLIATWIFKNERFTMVTKTNFSISMDAARNIWIHNVDETYTGKYFLYNSLRPSIELIIHAGPTAVQFAPNITMIQEHSGLNMSCLADCYPICSWTWTKLDASMGSDDVVSTENALYIQNISRQDSGNYSCRVLNNVTGISLKNYTFINIVYGPDVITFNPSSKIIQLDETNFITITCSAECFPPCQTGWAETNEDVLITGKELKLVSIKKNSSFTCHATNALKDNSTISDTIYVIVKPEINYYTTKAMTSEENANEFPSKLHLMYVLLGIGIICVVCLLACLLRKLISCFRMDKVSTKISLTDSNEDEETETLREENLYGYYMTIISDADGELTSAIETDFQPGTEQLLMGQNVMYSHNESERPFVSDSVSVIVNEDVGGYLTPIHSQSVQLSDYIHPVHSGPANIGLVSRRHSAEF